MAIESADLIVFSGAVKTGTLLALNSNKNTSHHLDKEELSIDRLVSAGLLKKSARKYSVFFSDDVDLDSRKEVVVFSIQLPDTQIMSDVCKVLDESISGSGSCFEGLFVWS